MAIEIITKEDLQTFRVQLLNDISALLNNQTRQDNKEWLKGSDVRKLLGISPGKLQTLRISRQLPSTKVGGVHYYRYADIEKMMKGEIS
jgi:hypothetical protein